MYLYIDKWDTKMWCRHTIT